MTKHQRRRSLPPHVRKAIFEDDKFLLSQMGKKGGQVAAVRRDVDASINQHYIEMDQNESWRQTLEIHADICPIDP